MEKIVVIGGGSGVFQVLKGLKHTDYELASIVTSFDNGGSTGVLVDEFGILPPGDLRRSLVALSSEKDSEILRALFNYRFPKQSSLKGHNFGNLFLQALISIYGNPVTAVQKAGDVLNIRGKVLPISVDKSVLCAELNSGKIISGETDIDIPKHDGAIGIKRVFLTNKARITREAKESIISADLIIFGPGDLYTSILPNTLVDGFKEAIKKSTAKIVYISNIMTKWGETNDYKASDFVKTLLSYINKTKVDYIFCNNQTIPKSVIKKYKQERATPVEVDVAELKKYCKEIILSDFLPNKVGIIRHDSLKIMQKICQILEK
jgi:uncharacterized cofD-like protein